MNSHSICRVKVNFVVIKGINDSDEDIDKMINYLLEFKDDVIIKVSFLNYTKNVMKIICFLLIIKTC